MARLLWKIEFSQLTLVYCPDLSFGRLAPPLFGFSAASPSPVSANAAALSYLNRSFAAGTRAGDTLCPASGPACAADHSSQSSLGGGLTLAVPERSQQQSSRPASTIARLFRALPLVSRLVARRRTRKEHAAYDEELRELRLNSPQADGEAANSSLVDRSSPPVSRRQPGVRDTVQCTVYATDRIALIPAIP